MVRKTTSPAMDFIIAQLKKEPTVEYRTVKDRADERGMTIYPIMYGRAKALLGLVPTRPRKEKAGKARQGSLRKTTPRRSARSHGNGSVEDFEGQLVRAITDIQERATADSQRLRDAIRKAIEVVEAALNR